MIENQNAEHMIDTNANQNHYHRFNHIMKILNEKKNAPNPLENFEEIECLLKNADFSASMPHNLINDLLDLSKMENSSFNVNAKYFNLLDDVI